MNCPSCGSVMLAGQRFCDACGAGVADRQTPDASSSAFVAADTLSGGPGSDLPAPAGGDATGTLPGTPILLGDGEVLWRHYNAVQLRTREQGEGMIFVTDARVVLYARARGRGTQRPSALVQQVKLQHVTAVTALVSRRISLMLIVFTVLFGIAAIGSLASHAWLWAIILAAVTAFCAWRIAEGAAKRGTVGVAIHGGSEGVPIAFGQGSRSGRIAMMMKILVPAWLYRMMGVYTAVDVLNEGEPGLDSERLIAELGALIFDLQSRGNLADTHWGVVGADPSYSRVRA
jgi:hypothetical protein